MKSPINLIWLAIRNHDLKILAVGRSYEEVNEPGRKKLKKGETFHIRTFAEMEEGEIACKRNHCYKNHFNFCPHCGNKLVYKEDEFTYLSNREV